MSTIFVPHVSRTRNPAAEYFSLTDEERCLSLCKRRAVIARDCGLVWQRVHPGECAAHIHAGGHTISSGCIYLDLDLVATVCRVPKTVVRVENRERCGVSGAMAG